VRALVNGGFADLHHPDQWTLDHVRSSTVRLEYEAMVSQMLDSLDFMKTIRAEEANMTRQVDMFSSHEGLILDFEQAMTRKIGDKWYNVGAHFLWIGDRTRQLDGAHIGLLLISSCRGCCGCCRKAVINETLVFLQSISAALQTRSV